MTLTRRSQLLLASLVAVAIAGAQASAQPAPEAPTAVDLIEPQSEEVIQPPPDAMPNIIEFDVAAPADAVFADEIAVDEETAEEAALDDTHVEAPPDTVAAVREQELASAVAERLPSTFYYQGGEDYWQRFDDSESAASVYVTLVRGDDMTMSTAIAQEPTLEVVDPIHYSDPSGSIALAELEVGPSLTVMSQNGAQVVTITVEENVFDLTQQRPYRSSVMSDAGLYQLAVDIQLALGAS